LLGILAAEDGGNLRGADQEQDTRQSGAEHGGQEQRAQRDAESLVGGRLVVGGQQRPDDQDDGERADRCVARAEKTTGPASLPGP
jgi:hypothetical protein